MEKRKEERPLSGCSKEGNKEKKKKSVRMDDFSFPSLSACSRRSSYLQRVFPDLSPFFFSRFRLGARNQRPEETKIFQLNCAFSSGYRGPDQMAV